MKRTITILVFTGGLMVFSVAMGKGFRYTNAYLEQKRVDGILMEIHEEMERSDD